MRFIYWIFLFITIIFLIYYSRGIISHERYYQYNDARSLSNYAVIICFTDRYNDYRSKTWKNKALGIKLQNYTSLKKNNFYKDYLVYTGKINKTLTGEVSNNVLSSGWMIISVDQFSLSKVMIFNYIYKVFLGSDSSQQVYISSKYTSDCLWGMNNIGKTTYNIKHLNTGLYLSSSEPKNAQSFLRQNTTSLKYNFGIVSLKPKPFNWLILPHPPIWTRVWGTYKTGKNACESRGMSLCSMNQLQKAVDLNSSICANSWINNYNENNNTLNTGWPMSSTLPNGRCGRKGLNLGSKTICESTNCRDSTAGAICCPKFNMENKKDIFYIDFQGESWFMDRQWYDVYYSNSVGHRRIFPAFYRMFREKPLGYQATGIITNDSNRSESTGNGMVILGSKSSKWYITLRVLQSNNGKYTGNTKKIYYNYININFGGESWVIDSQWYQGKNGVGMRKIWPAFIQRFGGNPETGMQILGRIINNPNRTSNSGNGMKFVSSFINCKGPVFNLEAIEGRRHKYWNKTIDLSKYGHINKWIEVPGYGDCRADFNPTAYGGRNYGDGVYGPWGYHNGKCYNSITKCKKKCDSDGNCVAFSWRPKSKGCTFFCNKRSGLCHKKGNLINSLPCYNKTSGYSFDKAKCYTKTCNQWLGGRGVGCGNKPLYINYIGTSAQNKGIHSLDKCKELCTLDQQCSGYVVSNNGTCYNYKFKPGQKIAYTCGIPLKSSPYSGDIKIGLPRGCFRDCKNGRRDLQTLTVRQGAPESVCALKSRLRGQQYYGHQWRGQCWSGNRYDTQGPLQSCTPKRTDNWRGGCRNMVYANSAVVWMKRTGGPLVNNTYYYMKPYNHPNYGVIGPNGLRVINRGWNNSQKWVIKKMVGNIYAWWVRGQWVTRPNNKISHGDVVSLYNPLQFKKSMDCAWSKCTLQPYTPPYGNWGTPYRIWGQAGQRMGEVIFEGDLIRLERLWHWRWDRNAYVQCNNRKCWGGFGKNSENLFMFTQK